MSEDKPEAPEQDAAEMPEVDAVEAPELADTESSEPLSPEEEISRLAAELVTAQEDVLRAQADAINAQRRAQAEAEKARKFALERFAGELLPVADNLERALEAAGDSPDSASLIEGVELTLKSFMDVIAKNGIEVVDPMGEPFDPQVAQAMSMVENGDVEPNTVIAVMQKGYVLNGRLLRPAMVMVSKAPA